MNEQVTHPHHYAACAPSWEPIDVIERYRLNFHVGNALKYIVRCERSGKRDNDVMKALYYLTRNKAMKAFDLPQAVKLEGDEYANIERRIMDDNAGFLSVWDAHPWYANLERRIMDDNVFRLDSLYLRSVALLCIVDPDSALHLIGDLDSALHLIVDLPIHQKNDNG